VPARSDRFALRLDNDVARDTAAERDLHPVDPHEQRAAERAASGQADGISKMDPEIAQPPLQAVPGPNIEDSRLVSRFKLVERHDAT
jgi:hypothetical protein